MRNYDRFIGFYQTILISKMKLSEAGMLWYKNVRFAQIFRLYFEGQKPKH